MRTTWTTDFTKRIQRLLDSNWNSYRCYMLLFLIFTMELLYICTDDNLVTGVSFLDV